MQNYVAPGEVVTFTAPSGGVVSGQAYLIGALVVIATGDAAEGAMFVGLAKGVVDVAKVDQEAWTEGQKVYFDGSASPVPLFTTVSGTLCGAAVRAVPLSLVLASEDTNSPPSSPPPVTISDNTIKVDNYTDLGNNTVTVTVNGRATVLTEGSGADFLAETSDEVTATNRAAALNDVPGITASASTDTVTVTVVAPSTTGRVRLDGAAR
jgi:predicted RecA/RadA family phage recombinase